MNNSHTKYQVPNLNTFWVAQINLFLCPNFTSFTEMPITPEFPEVLYKLRNCRNGIKSMEINQ